MAILGSSEPPRLWVQSFSMWRLSSGGETCMDQRVRDGVTQTEISTLYAQWLEAVRSKDVDAIIAFYTEDVVAFDAIFALQFKGRPAYRDHWKQCMEFCPADNKEMVFELHDLEVESHT